MQVRGALPGDTQYYAIMAENVNDVGHYVRQRDLLTRRDVPLDTLSLLHDATDMFNPPGTAPMDVVAPQDLRPRIPDTGLVAQPIGQDSSAASLGSGATSGQYSSGAPLGPVSVADYVSRLSPEERARLAAEDARVFRHVHEGSGTPQGSPLVRPSVAAPTAPVAPLIAPPATVPKAPVAPRPVPGVHVVGQDGAQNIVYDHDQLGQPMTAFNVNNGAAMAARRFAKGGTTDGDVRLWSIIYNGGRGATRPEARETPEQVAAGLAGRRAMISAFAAAMGPDGAASGLSYRMLPEHLGYIFLTPLAAAALSEAAWRVHYEAMGAGETAGARLERQKVHVVDLMTHEATRVPFRELVVNIVHRERAQRDQSRAGVADNVHFFDERIRSIVGVFRGLHYRTRGGLLAIANTYNPAAYAERLSVGLQRVAFAAAHGRAYTDLPSIRDGLPSAPMHAAAPTLTPEQHAVYASVVRDPTAKLRLDDLEEMQRRHALVAHVL